VGEESFGMGQVSFTHAPDITRLAQIYSNDTSPMLHSMNRLLQRLFSGKEPASSGIAQAKALGHSAKGGEQIQQTSQSKLTALALFAGEAVTVLLLLIVPRTLH